MINALKKFWIKNHTKFILLTSVILFVIGLINFFFIFEITAQSNDECLWTPKKVSYDSVAVIFEHVKVNGVTWDAGIRDGDQLLSIDEVPAKNTAIASRTLDKVPSGDYATYKVLHNGQILETKVLVKKLISFSGLAFALLAFFWLIVGFAVAMVKPEGKTQILFYRVGIFAILFAMQNLLYRGNATDNPIFRSGIAILTVDTLWTLGGCFLGFLIIRFFCIFPKENKLIQKGWFRRILVIAPFLLFISVTAIKFLYVYFSKEGDGTYSSLANIIGIVLSVCFVSGLVLLFLNYIRLKDKRERNSIFVILVSYFIGTVVLVYTSTLATSIAGLIFNNPYYFTPIILVALLPIAFGYSIFRYSLMDISEVVKNTIVYGAATITIAALYFVLIYVVGQSVSSAIGTEYQGIIAGVIFVAFALVFQSSKDKFQNYLTEKFYPEQFNFQKGLLKFNSEISTIVGRENIYDSIKELFVDSLGIKTFGLLLKNEKGVYELKRHQGIFNPYLNISEGNKIVEKYCLECMMFGKKQIIERQDFKDVLGNSADKFLAEDIYTIVPLFIKSKLIGLLLFGLKQTGAQFTGKDLDLLLSATLQAAISIENARLYESEAEKQKMERDLENAREIQETLLPKTFPQIKKLDISGIMIPAMHVGGDYFDFIKVSDKQLFVVVGDVSGKGLSASFYMSKLQTMIRLYCTEGRSPRDVLIEVNKNIYENIERNWFITVSLGLFDIEKGIVTFCRAGHVPLIKVNHKCFEEIHPAGIGVGLNKGETFESSLEEVAIPLHSNDLFLFYSDGVTELMNSANELFGLERVKDILENSSSKNCAEVEKVLLDGLEEFRGSAPQYDDVTILLVKYF